MQIQTSSYPLASISVTVPSTSSSRSGFRADTSPSGQEPRSLAAALTSAAAQMGILPASPPPFIVPAARWHSAGGSR